MDFNQLMAKMRELDQPTTEECGMSPMPTSSPSMTTPPPAPPSMSVNLNAQGMDNIEQMMRLFQKVNPDMMPKEPMPMPSLTSEPKIFSIKSTMDASDEPAGDMDSDYDKDGTLDPHEKDHASEKPLLKSLDLDNDGDHDMDDHNMQKKGEAYANEPDEKSVKGSAFPFDAAGDDLHKEKGTFPKVAGADNPMQRMENTDLRSKIRAELLQRLEEAKSRR